GKKLEMMNLMNLQKLIRHFYAYLNHALSGERLEELNDHLKTCLDCCGKLQFSRQLDDFVKSRLGDQPLPEGIEARIRKQLVDEVSLQESGKKEEQKMSDFSDDEARETIRGACGRVRPPGPAVAETSYGPEDLAGLPREAVEFALGVANPVRHANLHPGETVLDLGCGAGIDTLLAARA